MVDNVFMKIFSILSFAIITSFIIFKSFESPKRESSVMENTSSTENGTVKTNDNLSADGNDVTLIIAEEKPKVITKHQSEIERDYKELYSSSLESQRPNKDVKEYKERSNCFSYFEYDTEKKIDDFLIQQANVSSMYTPELLEGLRANMVNKMKVCNSLVGDSSEEEFIKETFERLEESAEGNNHKSQLFLALALDNKALGLKRTSPEASELHNRSLVLLKKASVVEPQAKVFLAMKYLDHIHHPEIFNIEEAERLVKEAQKITGNEYKALVTKINNFN